MNEPGNMEEGLQQLEKPTLLSSYKAGSIIEKARRLISVAKNETVREAFRATARTIVNVGVSVADLVPGFGDSISWAADVGKFTDWYARKAGVSTDLTPDVSRWVAVGSELAEIPTLGFIPSHAVETILQAKADIPRIREGVRVARQILAKEARDYSANKPQINSAMETFGVSVTQQGGKNG